MCVCFVVVGFLDVGCELMRTDEENHEALVMNEWYCI